MKVNFAQLAEKKPFYSYQNTCVIFKTCDILGPMAIVGRQPAALSRWNREQLIFITVAEEMKWRMESSGRENKSFLLWKGENLLRENELRKTKENV